MAKSATYLLLLLTVGLVLGQAVHASGDDDHGHDDHAHEKCACKMHDYGVAVSCTALNMYLVEGAISYLQNATNNCATKDACKGHYFLLQSHHDFCPHDVLPPAAEKALHDYEDFYEDCHIPRQYDVSLPNCASVSCKNPQLFLDAVSTLKANNCNTTCTSNICTTAIQTVLMGHDTCEEDELPQSAEEALHDYEEVCEDQLCNTVTKIYDPEEEHCPGHAHGSSSSSDDEVKLDVLIGIVCAIGAVLFAFVGVTAYMAHMEKKGRPVFAALA